MWNLWLNVNKRPKVTCDIREVDTARWTPDLWYDEGSDDVVEGIRIKVRVGFLIANNGPVDTTIKDIYIGVKYNKGKSGRLTSDDWQSEQAEKNILQQQTHIMPRGTWGPKELDFSGSLFDENELPMNIEAELVVEPVAHRPVRRKINLDFD